MKPTKTDQSSAVTGASQLVFILGHALGHSLSPLMHNAAFRVLRMPWVYAPLEISKDQVKTAVGILRSSNVRGSNVTVPYKETVLPYLDQVEGEARWLGSVNTIYRKGNQLVGTSTDGEGFLRSLGIWRKKLRGSKGLLVGSGGAAKAVAGALAQSGVKTLIVANRSQGRARQLVGSLLKRHPRLQVAAIGLKEGEKFLNRCDWVIQSTSLGLKSNDSSPLSLKTARPMTLVVDLIYHRETAFLSAARKLRLPRLSGMGMLAHQGALSFEYWTGRKAPLAVMQRVLLHHLATR